MLYSCPTVCTHNNNIYVFLLCKFEYLIIFPARPGNEFICNPIVYLFYIVLRIDIIQIFFYTSFESFLSHPWR